MPGQRTDDDRFVRPEDVEGRLVSRATYERLQEIRAERKQEAERAAARAAWERELEVESDPRSWSPRERIAHQREERRRAQ